MIWSGILIGVFVGTFIGWVIWGLALEGAREDLWVVQGERDQAVAAVSELKRQFDIATKYAAASAGWANDAHRIQQDAVQQREEVLAQLEAVRAERDEWRRYAKACEANLPDIRDLSATIDTLRRDLAEARAQIPAMWLVSVQARNVELARRLARPKKVGGKRGEAA